MVQQFFGKVSCQGAAHANLALPSQQHFFQCRANERRTEISLMSSLRNLWQLAWPVFIGQLAVMLTGVMDTVMAGQLPAAELAAVGVGSSIFISIFVTLMGVLIALSPICARLFGAGEHSAIGEQVRQSMWLALALSGLCALLLQHPEPLLALCQLAPDVDTKVRAYLGYLTWGVAPLLLFRVFYGLSTAVSLPRPVMSLNIVALLLKYPLNQLCMHGGWGLPALGGPGCALASALINWLLLLASLLYCRYHPTYQRFALFERWSWPRAHILVPQLRLGLPIGATFLVDVTAYTFMALFVARLGAQVSAAHQVAANLVALCFMLPLSLGHAASVLVSQALGAGQTRQARHTAFLALALGLLLALPVSASLWLGRAPIAAFYLADAHVAAIASALIALVAAYHVMDAVQAVAVNVLRGYQRTVLPMGIYAAALWGLGLGGGYLLAFQPPAMWPMAPLGAAGFWLAAIAGLGLAGALVSAYLWHISRPTLPAQSSTTLA